MNQSKLENRNTFEYLLLDENNKLHCSKTLKFFRCSSSVCSFLFVFFHCLKTLEIFSHWHFIDCSYFEIVLLNDKYFSKFSFSTEVWKRWKRIFRMQLRQKMSNSLQFPVFRFLSCQLMLRRKPRWENNVSFSEKLLVKDKRLQKRHIYYNAFPLPCKYSILMSRYRIHGIVFTSTMQISSFTLFTNSIDGEINQKRKYFLLQLN